MSTQEDIRTTQQMAQAIIERLDMVGDEIADLDKEIAYLEANHCTGKVYMRSGTKKPAMRVQHGTGQSCPAHGEPTDDTASGRIRTYIGTDVHEQELVQELIVNRERLLALKRQRDRLTIGIQPFTLRKILRTLGGDPAEIA